MSALSGLSQPAARIALLLALIAVFLGLGFYAHSSELGRPFYGHPDDDWTHYHKHAVDVLENGPFIPSLPKAYTTPAGFLYIYSVAFIYRLFGVNPGAVYLAQSALLGFSVWLLFLAFGRGLSPSGKAALICMLVFYAVFDVQRPYTGRLLSENLAIWEVAFFFNLLLWGYTDNRSWARVASLAWLGVLYLTRPNFLPFAAACPVWLGIWRHGRGKAPYWEFALGPGSYGFDHQSDGAAQFHGDRALGGDTPAGLEPGGGCSLCPHHGTGSAIPRRWPGPWLSAPFTPPGSCPFWSRSSAIGPIGGSYGWHV